VPYLQKLERLEQLKEAVDQHDFATTMDDLELFDAIYPGDRADRAEEILVQLTRLLPAPQEGPNQETAGQAGVQAEAEAADADDSLLLPDVPTAVGEERNQARRQMIALLNEEIKATETVRSSRQVSALKSNLPYLRDKAIPPSAKEARVAFRMEDSSFRQVGRLTDLLLRLQKRANREKTHSENAGTTHDVVENKGSGLVTHDLVETKGT
jgi:hypothetical protein